VKRRSERLSRSLTAPAASLAVLFFLLIFHPRPADAQSVSLAWDPSPETNIAGYNVYRSEQAGAFSGLPVNGAALVQATTYADHTVQAGRTYYYVVTAVSTSGEESAYSNQVQTTPPAPAPAPPPAPEPPPPLPPPPPTSQSTGIRVISATTDPDGAPFVLDGDLNTRWRMLSFPQEIVFDLGGLKTVSGFYYREEWTPIDGYEVYVTNTLSSWGAPVASGAITSSGSAYWGVNISFTPTVGSYLKFRVTAGYPGASYGYIGELGFAISAAPTTTNKPPVVNGGPDQTVTLPAAALLSATATDDGLPNNTLTYQWSVVSGSGVKLSAPNARTTQAVFPAAGTYVLRVTVSDGQLASSDDVRIQVNPAATTNKAPTVHAGADQTVTLPASATLAATASDDGRPNGSITYQWSLVSGAGANLGAPYSASTPVAFSAEGVYRFRVTVSDGELSATDDLIVTVNPPPPPPAEITVIVGSKNRVVLEGPHAVVSAFSADGRVARLELFIDGQPYTAVAGTSLTYRWSTRRLQGQHTIKVVAYDSRGVDIGSTTVTVTVK